MNREIHQGPPIQLFLPDEFGAVVLQCLLWFPDGALVPLGKGIPYALGPLGCANLVALVKGICDILLLWCFIQDKWLQVKTFLNNYVIFFRCKASKLTILLGG